ncbi:MAG: histidine phosphatase family protein [Parachlamydiaceae bacterium]|nr:histidine phosphatase family protein [Parachlamydiaceae bacterium]
MSSSKQHVYLIRHGETEWSLSGQHTGTTDIPLTENGKQEAKLFQPFFAHMPLSLVLTSPLTRARTTCELADLGGQAKIDRDLMEWNYGEYEGLTTKQIHETSPNWMLFRDGCPGGETPEQVSERVDRLIAKIRTVDGNIALFAHGHILRVLAVRWLGFPILEGCHFLLDPATLSILSYYYGIPAIKQWNSKGTPVSP